MRIVPAVLALLMLAPAFAATAFQGPDPALAATPTPAPDSHEATLALPVQPESACLPSAGCLDVPLVVDEHGDRMSGDLAFAPDKGIAFAGGRLTADPQLRFGSAPVCLGGVAIAGCGDITAVIAGPGLLGGALAGDATLAADLGVVQARITGVCAPGSSIRAIAQGGAVTCEADDVGTFTAGPGILLNGNTLSLDFTLAQARITGSCAVGSAIRVVDQDGTVACEVDDDTTYAAGAGLALDGTTFRIADGAVTGAMVRDGSVTASDIDAASIQRRITGTCPAGESIRVVNEDGTVACEVDTDTTYTAGQGLQLAGTEFSLVDCASGQFLRRNPNGAWVCQSDDAWSLAGDTGTDAEQHFVGTVDNVPLNFRVGNERVARFENKPFGAHNVILGHSGNLVPAPVTAATIGGGGVNGHPNQVLTSGGTVAGGFGNVAGHDENTGLGYAATVAGGERNEARGRYGTIAGGVQSAITTTGYGGFIGGGSGNRIRDSNHSAVAGGEGNIGAGDYGFIGGGSGNVVNGTYAAILGGGANVANGTYGVVLGGFQSVAAGESSLAFGRTAKAWHDGSIVLADGALAAFASTAQNQFAVRALGGARIVTYVDAIGAESGVGLAPGAGTWTSLSDRNAKEGMTPVDPQAVLDAVAALPVSTWRYKSQPGALHMGLMAQDFRAAFGLGASETGIDTVDADGVALAAIQGLHQQLEQERARNNALEARLAALEALVLAR